MLLIYLSMPSIIYQFDKCEPKNMLFEWKTSWLDLVVYTATGVSVCLSRIFHFCKSNLHSNWQLEYMYVFQLEWYNFRILAIFYFKFLDSHTLNFILTKLKNHITPVMVLIAFLHRFSTTSGGARDLNWFHFGQKSHEAYLSKILTNLYSFTVWH